MKKIKEKDIQKVLPKLFRIMNNPGVERVGLVIECYTRNAHKRKYKVISRILFNLLKMIYQPLTQKGENNE